MSQPCEMCGHEFDAHDDGMTCYATGTNCTCRVFIGAPSTQPEAAQPQEPPNGEGFTVEMDVNDPTVRQILVEAGWSPPTCWCGLPEGKHDGAAHDARAADRPAQPQAPQPEPESEHDRIVKYLESVDALRAENADLAAAPSPAREHGLAIVSRGVSNAVECKCGELLPDYDAFTAHLRAEVRWEMLRELEFVAQDFDDWKAEHCAKHLREWIKVEREGQ